MTAEEARQLRYSKEDEQIGHKNTFNLLVGDYVNVIESKIRSVARYTDAGIYPLPDLCNRGDVVEKIVDTLRTDGFTVSVETKYRFDIKACYFDLYITWRKPNEQQA